MFSIIIIVLSFTTNYYYLSTDKVIVSSSECKMSDDKRTLYLDDCQRVCDILSKALCVNIQNLEKSRSSCYEYCSDMDKINTNS